jgi:hypothetical protein
MPTKGAFFLGAVWLCQAKEGLNESRIREVEDLSRNTKAIYEQRLLSIEADRQTAQWRVQRYEHVGNLLQRAHERTPHP